jgi:3-oxoacyl-[acyl-carrier-protein] synthase-3
MIGIHAIASYVPQARLSNYERRVQFDLTDDFIEGKLGVRAVSRKRAEEDTASLCEEAYRSLNKRLTIEPGTIDAIIVCTQNPDGHGIPHTSALVHAAVGAGEECAAFDLSLGCSGYVYGLSVVKSFLEANGLRRGLFFTADPYSKILDPDDRNTVLLFGDAATVTLLDEESLGGVWIPRKFLFGTRGAEGSALNNRSGRLEMNGRAVFNFSATAVPVQIKQLLAQCRLDVSDIDLFLLHQGSRFIVDTLAKRLGLPSSKVPCNLAEQGNTVSSSIPLLFEPYLAEPSVRRVLMSGFGVGLSWASCLVERSSAGKEPL